MWGGDWRKKSMREPRSDSDLWGTEEWTCRGSLSFWRGSGETEHRNRGGAEQNNNKEAREIIKKKKREEKKQRIPMETE